MEEQQELDFAVFMDFIEQGDYDRVVEYLEAGIDPSQNENYAIVIASRYGHLEIVRRLLQDERVNPAEHDNDAIVYAAFNDNVEIVRLLLQDERVNPADNNNDAIIQASTHDSLETARLLLEDERVNPADQDNIAIIQASNHGHTQMVALLLQDERVNPTAEDNKAIRDVSSKKQIRNLPERLKIAFTRILDMLIKWMVEHNVNPETYIDKLQPADKRLILEYYDIAAISKFLTKKHDFGFDLSNQEDLKFIDALKAKYSANKSKYDALMTVLSPSLKVYEMSSKFAPETFEMKGLSDIISEYAFEPMSEQDTIAKQQSVIAKTLTDLGIDEIGIVSMIAEYLL